MHRHPLTCILPPHMLQAIIENGSASQRDFAILTFKASEQFRGQREGLTGLRAAVATLVATGKHRTIYDAKHGSSLPGTKVREEGDLPSGDLAVDEAYDGSGATYDLYSDIYGRNSIDGNGMKLDSTVHYQQGYDNAFWDGQQMVYGDGDEDSPPAQRLFNRFTIAIDVIGHELTHGVTQFEAKLNYSQQSGALNESFSDVFGSLVKQHHLGQMADKADWIIGEGLFSSNVNGVGIRSMKEPGTAYDDPVLGKDPQPGHMNDYVDTVNDNGGVHINSGIPNHAFYLIAMELGGFAWEKAGLIWYLTLRDKLGATSNFQEAAALTYQVAADQFGPDSLEQQAVSKGWAGVGIDATATTPPTSGDGCLSQMLRLIGAAPAKSTRRIDAD